MGAPTSAAVHAPRITTLPDSLSARSSRRHLLALSFNLSLESSTSVRLIDDPLLLASHRNAFFASVSLLRFPTQLFLRADGSLSAAADEQDRPCPYIRALRTAGLEEQQRFRCVFLLLFLHFELTVWLADALPRRSALGPCYISTASISTALPCVHLVLSSSKFTFVPSDLVPPSLPCLVLLLLFHPPPSPSPFSAPSPISHCLSSPSRVPNSPSPSFSPLRSTKRVCLDMTHRARTAFD